MSDKQRLFQYAVLLHKYTQTETNNGKMYDGAEWLAPQSQYFNMVGDQLQDQAYMASTSYTLTTALNQ